MKQVPPSARFAFKGNTKRTKDKTIALGVLLVNSWPTKVCLPSTTTKSPIAKCAPATRTTTKRGKPSATDALTTTSFKTARTPTNTYPLTIAPFHAVLVNISVTKLKLARIVTQGTVAMVPVHKKSVQQVFGVTVLLVSMHVQ